MFPRKTMLTALYITVGLIAVLLLALVIGVVMQVEDWGRDLTTNVAVTSDDGPDERLRPIESEQAPAELAAAVVTAAGKIPRWELAEQTEADGAVELHFIRTTGLWRFKDDIRVRIAPRAGGGSRLTAESRSRVGKGDLGQNPRNLRELLAALRKAGS